MPQKHDIGWKKRQAYEKAALKPYAPTPEGLARDLVRRGLASEQILTRWKFGA